MLETHTYVEGASLTGLLFEVRDRFASAPPVRRFDSYSVPNSIKAIALESYESKPLRLRLRIVRELVEDNPSLFLEESASSMFATARTPADYISDLVAEAVREILRRDPSVQREDELRLAATGRNSRRRR